MKKFTFVALTCSIVFILVRLNSAHAQVADDVEHTRAFLVKLKTGATTRAAPTDDWQLIPLVSEAQTRGEPTAVGNWWYLAPQDGAANTRLSSSTSEDWDAAYDFVTKKSGTRGANQDTPLSRRKISGDEIDMIEPDFAFYSPEANISSSTAAAKAATAEAGKTVVGSSQTRHWPDFPKVGAYQENEFSQLKLAREAAMAKMEHDHLAPVRIAFLDTGYDAKHVTRPSHIMTGRNFVENKRDSDGSSLNDEPGPPGSQSHGTGTISILAGREIELADGDGKIVFSGWLGGAPFAEILPMRVATSVVHFENPFFKCRPSGTTRAILYAARNNCDVISMSHGGLPSYALADAINVAYQAGIAMFFASGDYLQQPSVPIHSPSFVVYPAAFSRTMAVCGVTATFKTYGKPPNSKYDPALGPVDSWRLRGNWGPADFMRNAIAAFSPNVPWAHLPMPKYHETAENVVDLDGQGTSASTPQVAAAAAIWLQYHRGSDLLKANWRTWKKAELVYAALRDSAKQVKDSAQADYCKVFFGSGVLQARSALDHAPSSITLDQPQKPAKVGLGWIRLLGSIATKTRADGIAEETLKRMYGLELAQIAQRSSEVQQILEKYGGYNPDSETATPPADFSVFKKELLQAIIKDPHTSQHLKDALTTG